MPQYGKKLRFMVFSVFVLFLSLYPIFLFDKTACFQFLTT